MLASLVGQKRTYCDSGPQVNFPVTKQRQLQYVGGVVRRDGKSTIFPIIRIHCQMSIFLIWYMRKRETNTRKDDPSASCSQKKFKPCVDARNCF